MAETVSSAAHTMKTIRVGVYGGPQVLTTADVPMPVPAANDVLVRVAAVGVNIEDVLDRTGDTERTLPFALGYEAAGTIVTLGSDVAGWHTGERVAFVAPAAYAEYVTVPLEHMVRIPDRLDFPQAVAAARDGVTAHYLTIAHPIREGEWVLVRPATAGPGLFLSQLAKRRGARVIGIVETTESEENLHRLGAGAPLLWRRAELAADVRRLTDGVGVDVVFDETGNSADDVAVEWELDCLRPRGHLVLFGHAPFTVGFVNFDRLAGASLSVTSAVAQDYFLESGEFTRLAGLALEEVATGEVEAPVAATFPFAEAARAHQMVESRATSGKVILTP
jgi:NADPH2:quinone reductase